MRKQTTFRIDGRDKDYKVKELSTREWIQFLGDGNLGELDLLSLLQRVREGFIDVATNIGQKEIMDFTPSEIDIVWGKFREVNDVFFGLPGRLGIKGLWDQIRPAVYGACGSYVVEWLRRAMVEQPTMASVTSSMPSMSTSRESSKNSPSSPTPSGSEQMQTKIHGEGFSKAVESKRQANQPR